MAEKTYNEGYRQGLANGMAEHFKELCRDRKAVAEKPEETARLIAEAIRDVAAKYAKGTGNRPSA